MCARAPTAWTIEGGPVVEGERRRRDLRAGMPASLFE